MAIQWSDDAIMLASHALNDKDARVMLLTRQHGYVVAVLKFGATRKRAGQVQPAVLCACRYRARLETHMGVVELEASRHFLPVIMHHPTRLLLMQSAHALCQRYLAEQDAMPPLFDALLAFYDACANASPLPALRAYVLFEQALLNCTGFGLDVSCCVVTGETEHLTYISPKSGCAVSEAEGAPYHTKLFPLPAFLVSVDALYDETDIYNACVMHMHFLQQRLSEHTQRDLPDMRIRLMQHMETQYGGASRVIA